MSYYPSTPWTDYHCQDPNNLAWLLTALKDGYYTVSADYDTVNKIYRITFTPKGAWLGDPVVSEIPILDYLSLTGGKMSGAIDMSLNKIQNLGVPVANSDAATKKYVDDKSGDYLPTRGGKMVGDIDMSGHTLTNVKKPAAGKDVVTKESLLDLVFPVGSLYLTDRTTSPAAIFGGTWQQIKGRCLMGVGSAEDNTVNTFGAMSSPRSWSIGANERGGQDYHKLTIDELAKHNHPIQLSGSEVQESSILNWTYNQASRVYSGTDLVRPVGGDAAHNNMPPYYGVYIWKRTA